MSSLAIGNLTNLHGSNTMLIKQRQVEYNDAVETIYQQVRKSKNSQRRQMKKKLGVPELKPEDEKRLDLRYEKIYKERLVAENNHFVKWLQDFNVQRLQSSKQMLDSLVKHVESELGALNKKRVRRETFPLVEERPQQHHRHQHHHQQQQQPYQQQQQQLQKYHSHFLQPKPIPHVEPLERHNSIQSLDLDLLDDLPPMFPPPPVENQKQYQQQILEDSAPDSLIDALQEDALGDVFDPRYLQEIT